MCVFHDVEGHLGAVSENALSMGREAQGLSVTWAMTNQASFILSLILSVL